MRMRHVAVLCFGFAACVHRQPTLEQATAATIVAVDATYGLVVELCDAKEKAVIARPPLSLDADRAALTRIRTTCDKMFAVFEQTRTLSELTKELEQTP